MEIVTLSPGLLSSTMMSLNLLCNLWIISYGGRKYAIVKVHCKRLYKCGNKEVCDTAFNFPMACDLFMISKRGFSVLCPQNQFSCQMLLYFCKSSIES